MTTSVRLTCLAFNLNYLLDRGYYCFPIQEIKAAIKGRTLFTYLNRKISKDDSFDISLFDDSDRAWLMDQFSNLADTIDEERKLGVQKNGICLLLAYTLELIQQERKYGKNNR